MILKLGLEKYLIERSRFRPLLSLLVDNKVNRSFTYVTGQPEVIFRKPDVAMYV